MITNLNGVVRITASVRRDERGDTSVSMPPHGLAQEAESSAPSNIENWRFNG